jgi:DNA invertase Pin-like site-specific DNA recombinase
MSAVLSEQHLQRTAVVYVRQSSMGQVTGHTESKRRQYDLAAVARAKGFVKVETIDEDQGRSGSGMTERPGFNRLAGMVCSGTVGAVFCLEASRLARNGREWHQLIDLCALSGTLLIDSDAIYDPLQSSDRLMLGVKGTLSEYELTMLRQRALAARDSKAQRGELRMLLPPGYCWSDAGRIEIDPDERVAETVRAVFRRFRELGSVRQVLCWLAAQAWQFPAMRQGPHGAYVQWAEPRYHNVSCMIRNPTYAGAYVFGRTEVRTRLEQGWVRKRGGFRKPMDRWSVLLRGNHPGYITWDQYQEHQVMLANNAHMKKAAQPKSGRGGHALLSGLIRCGHCGRMMRVQYSPRAGNSHRYRCRGDFNAAHTKGCLSVGGARIDRAVCEQLLQALSPLAIEAAVAAADKDSRVHEEVLGALTRDLEAAQYEAHLAGRRHAAVDPDKRQVARELEARWEAALERVRQIESRIASERASTNSRPTVNRTRLMTLASDLTTAWNAAGTEMRTKQRLVRTLIREIVLSRDDAADQYIVVIHWHGGRHSEHRVARNRDARTAGAPQTNPVQIVRTLAASCSDREIAMTLNRMRCALDNDPTWTIARVAQLRERLEIVPFAPDPGTAPKLSIAQAARRLGVGTGIVRRLIAEGSLDNLQQIPFAPSRIDPHSLESETVRIGVRRAAGPQPPVSSANRDCYTLKLPGF